MCHFWVQNAPFALNKKSFVKIIRIISICILAPFSVQNFKKILRVDPELWGWVIFGSRLVHLPQTRTFLGKVINTISIYLLKPFIVQSFKRFLQWIKSYEDVPFWTQNGPICPKEVFFFRQTLLMSFMPMYIPKTKFKNQSINDILTIKEYWNLIGWESFLAITWESCFSQACSFFQNVKGPEEPSFYINSKQN